MCHLGAVEKMGKTHQQNAHNGHNCWMLYTLIPSLAATTLPYPPSRCLIPGFESSCTNTSSPTRNTAPLQLGASNACTAEGRSEEHTSELQSLIPSQYAVFCLKKKNITN